MTEQEQQTAIKPFMAIEPRRTIPLFPRRREDYPIVKHPESKEEHVVLPIRDYRRFRGDTRFWQFLFVLMTVGFGFLFWVAMTKPPITVEKPLVVEKEVPVVVPSKCLFLCK